MPRMVLINTNESLALLALRRSVWQLAVLGIATATALARIAPQYDVAAAWSALIPLSALATLYRQQLLDLISTQRKAVAPDNSRRRRAVRKQPQARRAVSHRASKQPQPAAAHRAMG